jgi:hypothetical protein
VRILVIWSTHLRNIFDARDIAAKLGYWYNGRDRRRNLRNHESEYLLYGLNDVSEYLMYTFYGRTNREISFEFQAFERLESNIFWVDELGFAMFT